MKTAVGYARISKDLEEEGAGVARQQADVRKLAAELGCEVREMYVDNNVSGFKKRGEKTAWARMLRDVKADPPDYVLLWKGDRITRRMGDIELINELHKDYGMLLWSVQEGNVFKGPWPVMAGIARWYSEETSTRVRRAHEERRGQGIPANGGLRPFGYERDRVTLVPREAQVLRYVVERIVAGEPTTSVLRWLNDSGVPTVTGARWSSTALKQVLRNPRYVGDLAVLKKDPQTKRREYRIVGEGKWEPVLDRKTWQALQAALDERGNNVRGRPKRHTLLAGLVRCAECGTQMFSHQGGTKGKPLLYYRCARTLGGCGAVQRRRDDLDRYVVEYVLANVDPFRVSHEMDALEEEIVDLDQRLSDLAEERKGWLAKARLERSEAAADIADAIQRDMVPLQRQMEQSQMKHERLRTAQTGLDQWAASSLEEQRAYLRSHVVGVWCQKPPARGAFDPALVDVVLKGANTPESSPVTA